MSYDGTGSAKLAKLNDSNDILHTRFVKKRIHRRGRRIGIFGFSICFLALQNQNQCRVTSAFSSDASFGYIYGRTARTIIEGNGIGVDGSFPPSSRLEKTISLRRETQLLRILSYTSCLSMTSANSDENLGFGNENGRGKKRKKNGRNHRSNRHNVFGKNNTTSITSTTSVLNPDETIENDETKGNELLMRVSQLESLVASQSVEIRKLKENCKSLSEAATAFASVVDLLRQAGMNVDTTGKLESERNQIDDADGASGIGIEEEIEDKSGILSDEENLDLQKSFLDNHEIFGSAPATVIDAADAAGASVLAAILGGKQRILVDVRDAELTRDPDILVQFIELAILPVAAGLEGLKSTRNRVKIVFPTVSQLMSYRRSMCLSAPEVVSLSTLGFEPVEKKDNLVVIVAPSPDDNEGLAQMNELLAPSDPFKDTMTQPIVVVNPHMVPISGPASDFEKIYHLRLLTVQYLTGDIPPEGWVEGKSGFVESPSSYDNKSTNVSSAVAPEQKSVPSETDPLPEKEDEDAALEAALEHAHERGVHQGVTRAMVIRSYPKPWHVFVDTSPDTDADFEVAATFDEEPSQEDINYAIVECLEGSEREDELVAQQMQQALESGQLNKVAEMLGLRSNVEVDENDLEQTLKNIEDEEFDDEDDWDPFDTDTV